MLRFFALLVLLAGSPGCFIHRSGLGGGSVDAFAFDTRADTGPLDAFAFDAPDAIETRGDAPIDVGNDAAVDTGADALVLDSGRRNRSPIDIGASTDLRTAGAYALLASSAISSTGGTSIRNGHVGISPGAASLITGFTLIPDASTEFSTSILVPSPGRVYGADYGAPTPANLTAAVESMRAAYTDGAGRTSPDGLNLGAGELGGLALLPGLYRWTTATTMTTDITLTGGRDDVWILQLQGAYTVSGGASVILAGGARSQNVFWVVGGAVTIAENSSFRGVILGATSLTIAADASLLGRALVQTAITLSGNAIKAP